MPSLDNLIVRYCVGIGKGLGRVKNKKSTWNRFARMFDKDLVLVDTTCTFAEYMALGQDEKLEKKRAPGNWMAAHFREGKRKLSHIIGRSCITFDMDHVTADQLDDIRRGLVGIGRYAWIMHTTRAHCPEAPRVRLIIPASRMMNAEETNAVTRLLALELAHDPGEAIEIPDLVSMRFNQTMFLPSVSRDQEYWVDRNDGEVLDVDSFLADNPGWEDFSLLPYQEAEKQRAVADPNRKMEDPREKPGYIGAWCRTYTVEDVIEEFLSDIYAPGTSQTETRYTYIPGSGANGAVVYDDGLFLHSNHGTDPIEGSANAWDLARIHLFGHLDDDAHANTTLSNLPSSKAMMEFAQKDERVAAEYYAHIAAELDDEFDDDDDDGDDEPGGDDAADFDISVDELLGGDSAESATDPLDDILADLESDGHEREAGKAKNAKKDMSWTANFRRKANGDLEPVLNNITLICENDPRIRVAVAYNEFTADPVCLRPIRAKKIELPSRELRADEKRRGRRWEDADDASIKMIASANAKRGGYETDFGSQTIQEAVLIAGRSRPIHPVKDFIRECHREWVAAGRPSGYIDALATKYFRCPDTPFHRESSTEFCVAAVARIYEPGCKFDHMLILEGATGAGKSTWLRNLSGGFFSEFRVDLDRLDRTVEAMRGNWFLEMAEMEKAKKADANLLKDFLSSTHDTIRLAYARRETTFPRQSVMCGTSNEDDYLTDPTSVRRYWVWKVHPDLNEFNPIDQDTILADRAMIWGEAYQTYLDRRAEQPHGPLHLALKSRGAIEEQRRTAESSRRKTATETIAEVLSEWLDRPVTRDEAEAQSPAAIDMEFDDDGSDGERFVRNMVSPRDAYLAVRGLPEMEPYRNADMRTVGKALRLVPGWRALGCVHRHGTKARWYCRGEDGPLWVPAGPNPGGGPGIDDLLG